MKSKLLENIVSLSVIKGMEYLLAFITFPYLVRVLAVENYGLIVFAQGIVNYFSILSDYGFNLIGPREIAQNDIKADRGQVFAEIFTAKVGLLLIWTFVFVLMLVGMKFLKIFDTILYVVLYINVIGNVLFPIWFFQGVQQMRYITVVNVIGRLISVICIFVFVSSPKDYIIAAFFQSITPLLAAFISWFIILRKYPYVLCMPKYSGIKKQLNNAWPVFTSTIAINLYTASNVVFLGLLTNNVVVGYFSGAKKIIDNITGLISPITQAIYPYISKKVSYSQEDAILFIQRIVLILGGGNLIISIIIICFASMIVRILLGDGYEQSILLLRIMAFLPFIISLSNIFGIQTMLTFGMQNEFSRILLLAAILNTCIVMPLIYLYKAIGVCIAITVTECFVTTFMWYILKKNGINLFGKDWL